MVNKLQSRYRSWRWLCVVCGILAAILICLKILRDPIKPVDLSQLTEKSEESRTMVDKYPPLADGAAEPKHSETATFEFPFLGVIRARESMESTALLDSESRKLNLQFRVFKDRDGRFVRAEYVKEGARNPEWPVLEIQEAMEMREQRAVSLVQASPPVQWTEVLKAVASEVPLSDAIRINITYVNYKILDQPVSPVFVVNVFGAASLLINTYEDLPNAEKRRKVRFLYDRFGEMLRADNCL